MKRTEKFYRFFFIFGLLASLTLLMLTVTPTHSQETSPQINDRAGFRRPTVEVLQLEGQLRGDVETRMSLGLNADVEYVQNLRGSAEDVGSDLFNVPMTQAEVNEMQERWDFASATRDTVLPYVRELPTFAGAFYDHSSNGDLIILLTAAEADVRNEISSLAPAGRETRVEIVDYTQLELRESIRMVWEVWQAVGGPEIYTIAVDEPANAVRIEVALSELEEAEKVISELDSVIGVPMFATVGERPLETACTASRENCHTPMKGGIIVRKGSTTGLACTMGFQIVSGSDVQFLTAGHCGYSGSNNRYHQGYGYVGSEQATLYTNNGIDVMRVQMSDSQASDSLFGSAASINAVDWPTTGLWVCASLGISNSNSCGNVTDNYTSWTGEACGCTIYGAQYTISTTDGDSGSPVYDGNLPYTAIGIHSGSGRFAILKDVLFEWSGWWIY